MGGAGGETRATARSGGADAAYHFLQHWFNLSDPTVEEALYDSRAIRHFVGIDLGREPVPDETTICKFRHLLETHQLSEQLFGLIRT